MKKSWLIMAASAALFLSLLNVSEAGPRRYWSGRAADQYGNVLSSASAVIKTSDTLTAATIYDSVTATSPVALSTLTTDSLGNFGFYTDDFDYQPSQRFNAYITKTGYTSSSKININVGLPILGTYTISSDTTVTTAIDVPKGVILSVNTGKVLTINGPFNAGLYQTFQCVGSEACVTFGSAQEVHPEWFGAKGDGSTDDTAAIQASITAAQGSLLVIAGTYKITSSITLPADPPSIQGVGVNDLFGTPSGSVIYAVGCNGLVYPASVTYSGRRYIRDIGIIGDSTGGTIGIDIRPTTNQYVNTTFDNVTVSGFETAYYLGRSRYINIVNNYLYPDKNGIYINGQAIDTTIRDNKIICASGSYASGTGIYMGYSTNRPESINVYNNLIYGFSTGVNANNVLYANIHGNTIDACIDLGVAISSVYGAFSLENNWIQLTNNATYGNGLPTHQWAVNTSFASGDVYWTKGTGWTISVGAATHAAGTASALEQAISTYSGRRYEIAITVSGRTAGSITPEIGTSTGTTYSDNGSTTQILTSAASGNFKINASSDFDGSINAVTVTEFIASGVWFQTQLYYPDFTGPKIVRGNSFSSTATGTSQGIHIGIGQQDQIKIENNIFEGFTSMDIDARYPYNLSITGNKLASETGTTSISDATNANPCQITSTSHGLITGDRVYITGLLGMSELSGHYFTVTKVDDDNVTLDSINSTSYGIYSSGGTIAKVTDSARAYIVSSENGLIAIDRNDVKGMIVIHPTSNSANFVIGDNYGAYSTRLSGYSTITAGSSSVTTTYASLGRPDFAPSSSYLTPFPRVFPSSVDLGTVSATAGTSSITINVTRPPATDTNVFWDVVSRTGSISASGTNGTLQNLPRWVSTGGTLSADEYAMASTVTMYSGAVTTENIANKFMITSNGSDNHAQRALSILFGAGYTGSDSSTGLRVETTVAGTQASAASTGMGGNQAISTKSYGTGHQNVGVTGYAKGADQTNIGIGGVASSTTGTSVASYGVRGIAKSTGTSGIAYGGHFSLDATSKDTTNSAALVADNLTTTNKIFEARDNGTAVMTIADGGNVGIGTTGPSYKLDVNGTGNFSDNLNLATGKTYNINGSPHTHSSDEITGVSQVFNVVDYGAKGDGSTYDTAAFQAACSALNTAGGGTLYIPKGTYKLFSTAADTTLCSFSGIDGVRIIGDAASFTDNAGISYSGKSLIMFQFSACKNVLIEGIKVLGTRSSVDMSGGIIFSYFLQGTRNIDIGNIDLSGVGSSFLFSKLIGDPDSYRAKNITIKNVYISDSYYGPNFQHSGDNADIEITTNNVGRSYFPYGVKTHKVKIVAEDNYGGDVNIASGGQYGAVTEDIDLDYTSTATTVSASKHKYFVMLHYGTSAGILRNIKIRLNIDYAGSPPTYYGYGIDIYSEASGQGHVLENLTVSGKINGSTYLVMPGSSFTSSDYMYNMKFQNLRLSSAVDLGLDLPALVDHVLFENVITDSTITLTNKPSAAKETYVNVKTSAVNYGLYTTGSASINGTTVPASKTLVVTTDKISVLAATSSSELAGVISDETGSGSLVYGTGPAITKPEVVKSSSDNLSAAQVSGSIINNYGQSDNVTLVLPAAASGYSFDVVLGTSPSSKYFRIDPNGSEIIYLDGTSLGAGKYVGVATAAIGNALSCVTFQTGAGAYSWYCATVSGTWVGE